MKNKLQATLSLALLLGSSLGQAQVITEAEDPTQLIGSDTLNAIMDNTIAALRGDGELSTSGLGIVTYDGIGSSAGERQLEGSPDVTGGEPFCNPNDPDGAPENNPGCEEIAPMSRPMDSSVCDDDNAAENAEGLAICRDGIVIITDNAGHQQYAKTGQCPNPNPTPTPNAGNSFPDLGTGNLRNSGTLPTTGYQIGANLGAGNEWQDVVRLIYTGCKNTDGECADTVDRAQRCNDPVRRELVSSWANLFDTSGDDCGTDACQSLRHAYRRDDSSGTTQVFLELIGVKVNLKARSAVISGIIPAITAIPSNFSFCDGGHLEGFNPDSGGTYGDPLRTQCDDADDLCGTDGTLGLVRAIRSPREGGYPALHCSRGLFARVPYMATSLPVCPDGTSPRAGNCRLPYYNDNGTKNFDCLNHRLSRHSTTNVDGRVYNAIMRDSAGNVQFISTNNPEIAQWRENMANLYFGLSGIGLNGGPFPASDIVCEEADATRQIGCLVSHTHCTIGYAGREAATTAPYDQDEEPVRLQGFGPSNAEIGAFQYPFARELYINALNGFENLTTDCLLRGGTADYCNDELRLAQEFYDLTDLVKGICDDAGYIPLDDSICVGAQESAGCGRPTEQAKEECLPE